MEDDERLPDEAAPEDVSDDAKAVDEAAEADVEASGDETATGQEDADDSPPSEEEEQSDSKRRRNARRERQKAYVAELEKKVADAEAVKARIVKAGEGDTEPKEEDFDDLTEYAAAKAVYMDAQRRQNREVSIADAEIAELQEQRQREIDAGFRERMLEAEGRYENFRAVALGEYPVTDAMAEAIKTAENGPDILYHLGSNPALATQIASLPPNAQAWELGSLSATLKAPKPKIQTSAPEPIKPVTARSSADRDPSKMSPTEYRAWRAKQGA